MTKVKSIALLAAVALAVLATGGTAQAAKAGKKVDIDVQAALITQVGNVGTLAGVGRHQIGKTSGQGALVYKRTEISPGVEEPVGTYYTDQGSISGIGTLEIQWPDDPNAPVPYTGSLRITKGTGEFRGVHGRLATDGYASNGTLSQITIHIEGRLRGGGKR